jgi:hypothetical protein
MTPSPLKNTKFYHENGKLYWRTSPRRQLYPLGLVVPAAFHAVPNSEVNRYKPAPANVNGNFGYKKLNYINQYIKVKKHPNLPSLWIPTGPVHNRYQRKNGTFTKITNHAMSK